MKSFDSWALIKSITSMIAIISAACIFMYAYDGVYWLVKYVHGGDSLFAREKALCIFMMMLIIPMCVFLGYQIFKSEHKPKQ